MREKKFAMVQKPERNEIESTFGVTEAKRMVFKNLLEIH